MTKKDDNVVEFPKSAYEQTLDNIDDYKKSACDRLAVQWSQNDQVDLRCSCPKCEHVSAPKRRNVKRTIITLLGEITYTRHYYKCPNCGHGFYPLDDDIKKDLGHGSMTRDITALALDFAMTDPYELAAERFELHHGIKLSRSGFQRIVEEAGERLAEKKTKNRSR